MYSILQVLTIMLCMALWVNTYNAAGVSRRQDQNVTNLVKNVNILKFGYYIWNPYETCIQKSPNMPGIGSLIRDIDVKISENWETNILFLLSKTNARILSVNIVRHASEINSGVLEKSAILSTCTHQSIKFLHIALSISLGSGCVRRMFFFNF